MELKDLEQFVAVAEAGGFRRASASLAVRQSVLSRRVRALEDELGVSLFERNRSGVRLTIAGQGFLDRIRHILTDLRTATTLAAQAGAGRNGSLRIGLLTSLSQGPHRELIATFIDQHPEVEIEIAEGSRGELFEQTRQRRLDVAIVSGEVPLAHGDSVTLFRSRNWVALPASHPLAGSHTVQWESLGEERFLVTSGGSGPDIHEHITRKVARLGQAPEVLRYCIGREALMNMVGLGLGITIVVEAWCATKYPGVVFRPIGNDTDTIPFTAVWLHDNDNPALRRFLSLARMSRQGD